MVLVETHGLIEDVETIASLSKNKVECIRC